MVAGVRHDEPVVDQVADGEERAEDVVPDGVQRTVVAADPHRHRLGTRPQCPHDGAVGPRVRAEHRVGSW